MIEEKDMCEQERNIYHLFRDYYNEAIRLLNIAICAHDYITYDDVADMVDNRFYDFLSEIKKQLSDASGSKDDEEKKFDLGFIDP